MKNRKLLKVFNIIFAKSQSKGKLDIISIRLFGRLFAHKQCQHYAADLNIGN